MEPIRLQKYISDCGVMSRRAAEREITSGSITVNGRSAELGQKINPELDKIFYNGRIVSRPLSKRYTYIMLYKPVGYVTTMSDEKGRKCVAELVEDVGERVYPVGRLDYDSEGLLLMTNDGDLTNKLTHPKHRIPKIYNVKLNSAITEEQFKALGKPMIIDDYKILPVSIQVINITEFSTILRMTLYEGRNRQIRKMCEALELHITKLKRVAIGDIGIGELRPGNWQKLTPAQVDYLKRETELTK